MYCTKLPLPTDFIITYPAYYRLVNSTGFIIGTQNVSRYLAGTLKTSSTKEITFGYLIKTNLFPSSLVLHMSTQNVQSVKYKISAVSSLPWRYVGTLQNSRNSWAPPLNSQEWKRAEGGLLCSNLYSFTIISSVTNVHSMYFQSLPILV